MRPLAIWAMQWALSNPNPRSEEPEYEEDEETVFMRHHPRFSRVAHLLKLPEEDAPKSFFQAVYDCTCRRLPLNYVL